MQLLARNQRPETAADDPVAVLSRADRAKTVLAAVVGPLITGYAAVAALLALVTAIDSVANFSVSGVLRAAGLGWLAAYQVPITILGRPLGVLPLLATAGVAALVARSASHAAQRLGYREPGQAVNLVAPIAGAHAFLGVSIAFLSIGASVSVEPLSAFLAPGFVSGLAATAGVARCCGFADFARHTLDPAAVRGLRAGALGMAALMAMGTLVVTLSLVLSVPTAGRLFGANSPGIGSGAGMLLLSLGYLPNAIVGALSLAIGPGFSIGSVSVSAFSFTGGPIPGIPLLAGMPEHAAPWWPLLTLLPAAAGALVGWSVRAGDDDPRRRLRTVGIAGALVAFGCVLLGTVAGGRLGSGAFDPVSIPVGLTSVAAFGWILVPGGLVAWFAGPRARPDSGAGDEEPAEACIPDVFVPDEVFDLEDLAGDPFATPETDQEYVVDAPEDAVADAEEARNDEPPTSGGPEVPS
ncbi:MAG TPA: DUF6350 family protein [Amycolatopsis sp.]|jgi:hypothetical protein|nr:DUF6350 family protein [Amycolatopsis sp.]